MSAVSVRAQARAWETEALAALREEKTRAETRAAREMNAGHAAA